jgi:S1-C subfamily serine protease
MDGQPVESVDRLYQALQPERVGRDCVVKLLRPGTTQPLYLTVRPLEAPEA